MGQYTVYFPKGPRRRSVYGRTRAEVSGKLTKALAERDGGMIFDDENLNVEEYLTRWLNDSVRGSVKQTTFENYSTVVNRHLVPVLVHVKLRSLSPIQVQGLYRQRLDSGLSARTVRLMHTTLHKALKQAVRWSLIPHNVTEATSPPKLKRDARREIHPLTEAQAKYLLSAVAGESTRSPVRPRRERGSQAGGTTRAALAGR